MSHNADFAIPPLVAILSDFHEPLVPSSVVGEGVGWIAVIPSTYQYICEDLTDC